MVENTSSHTSWHFVNLDCNSACFGSDRCNQELESVSYSENVFNMTLQVPLSKAEGHCLPHWYKRHIECVQHEGYQHTAVAACRTFLTQWKFGNTILYVSVE